MRVAWFSECDGSGAGCSEAASFLNAELGTVEERCGESSIEPATDEPVGADTFSVAVCAQPFRQVKICPEETEFSLLPSCVTTEVVSPNHTLAEAMNMTLDDIVAERSVELTESPTTVTINYNVGIWPPALGSLLPLLGARDTAAAEDEAIHFGIGMGPLKQVGFNVGGAWHGDGMKVYIR
jgi:hypothetical protein